MNWMGLDYGRRYIGVAVGHSVTQHASSVGTVSARKGVPDWKAIDQLVSEWQPCGFIIGYPTQLDGSEQKITRDVKLFRNHLHDRYQLPCIFVCEQLTTRAARDLSPRYAHKETIDAMSAAIILQQWFDEGMPSPNHDD